MLESPLRGIGLILEASEVLSQVQLQDDRTSGSPTTRVQLAISLASVGTAVCYVIVRFLCTRFYDQLGVTPEEAGLGQTELLAASVGLLVVVAFCCGIILYLVLLLVAFLHYMVAIEKLLKWLSDLLVAALKIRAKASTTASATADAEPVAELVGAAWKDIQLAIHRWWARFPIVLVFSILVVSIFVGLTAPYQAQAVLEGHAVGDWTTPWRVVPATVRWVRQAPAPDPLPVGHCVMYLGRADRTTALYDVNARSVVRVPSGEVVVTVKTSTDRCYG